MSVWDQMVQELDDPLIQYDIAELERLANKEGAQKIEHNDS